MLEAYREHVAERANQGIPPKPLSAEQVAVLVELLQSPPAGEEEFLLELLLPASGVQPSGTRKLLASRARRFPSHRSHTSAARPGHNPT